MRILRIIFCGGLLTISFLPNAQNKWDSLIYLLVEEPPSSELYGELLVEIAWQISELDPDTANYYTSLAMDYAQKKGDDSILCRALIAQSAVRSYKGKHAESIELSYKAIRLAEELRDSVSIMDASNNIGIDLYYLEDYQGAITYYQRLIEIAKLVNNQIQLGYGYNNIALIKGELGQVEEEIEFYNLALEAFNKINDAYGLANTQVNLGTAYNKVGKSTQAIENLKNGYEVFQSMENSNGEADALTILAEIYLKEGEYARSLELLKSSNQVSEKFGLDLQLQANDRLLYQVYEAIGNKTMAFNYLKSYHEQFKKVRETEQMQLVADLREAYESEKKEQEIARLSQENEIIQLRAEQTEQQRFILFLGLLFLVVIAVAIFLFYRSKEKSNKRLIEANQQLEQLNQTKNRLFSIISHDLKSPLSSFHLITKSLTDNWDSLEKDHLKDFLITLRDSSANVRDMMDNLLKWALAQTDQLQYEPQSLNPGEVISEVKNQLHAVATLKKMEINIRQDDSLKIEADKAFLEIVIRNLVSNALKYSEVQKKIEVMVESHEGMGVISIQDQGVGMEQQQIDALFSGDMVAHDIQNSSEKGTGLGLVLCKELVHRMNGKLEVTSKINEGTTFRLMFPKAA